MRKMALMMESTYNALNLLFAWFALANYYIFFVSLRVYTKADSDVNVSAGDLDERP